MTAPHNFDAEQAVLGAIIVNNTAYQHVAEFLLPEHFADPLHGKIFDGLGRRIDRGQKVSAITLQEWAAKDDELRAAGGSEYLVQLAAASVHALDVEQMARVVHEAWKRRRLLKLGEEIAQQAEAPDIDDDADQQIERAERVLCDLADGPQQQGFRSFAVALDDAMRAAEAAHSGRRTGLKTGFGSLDRMLGGLHRSDLVILAGRPSQGKSALAANIGFHVARTLLGTEERGVVGFYSVEMHSDQIVNRIIADQAGLIGEKIRRGELNAAEMDRYQETADRLRSLPLEIDHSADLTLASLRSRARRLKRTRGLALLIVDYLQLVASSARAKAENRVQEVSEITRGLKTLAKEIDAPVLALSQLSRKVEERTDKRPHLSDLRESGSIEQDADVVMFIYRAEYYLERSDKKGSAEHLAAEGKAEVIVAKQRHGPTGTVHLHFDGPRTKFSDPPAGPSERYSAMELQA